MSELPCEQVVEYGFGIFIGRRFLGVRWRGVKCGRPAERHYVDIGTRHCERHAVSMERELARLDGRTSDAKLYWGSI